MALKDLFKSAARRTPLATGRNHHGSPAYTLDSKTALAQLASTGCFAQTFYVSGTEQLELVLAHAEKCSPEYVAKVAIHARQRGHMKDMPAFLLAHLATRGPAGLAALKASFDRVIDNGRMLRNFVQILRSGQLGRKSLGSAPKKLVQRWLMSRTPMQLFRDSVGQDPSIADVIKMVHPKPTSDEQRAMFAYLIGKPFDVSKLPAPVLAYEAFKRGEGGGEVRAQLRGVPSRMLTSLPLGTADWSAIAERARWHETRMNLNTFHRHGVLNDPAMVAKVAARLADPEAVRHAKVFPYQLLTAYTHATQVPGPIREALQDAMEHSVANVPVLEGRVVLCPDVSSSMSGAITGYRRGATSMVRCVDVAGLVTAALLRKNPLARVIPFDTAVRQLTLNPRDSVMTIAGMLGRLCGGGTSCSVPLAQLNREKAKVDTVIYVSDNESWMDANGHSGWRSGTAMMDEWTKLRRRNPKAKLVCIDLTPNTQKQAIERADILNVGGFSDSVFDVVAEFVNGEGTPWVDHVERITL